MTPLPSTAIYIHWPFCESKCPYCDFNSHVRDQIHYQKWFDGFKNAIGQYSEYLKNKTVTSIFFGGGTPTLMPPELVAFILDELQSIAPFAKNVEITLEGNPSSTEAQKLEFFKKSGINRLSLGVQSFREDDLQFLGRRHSVTEAKKAIEIARGIFSNYSFDLIYARPNQTVTDWEKELEEALCYTPPHLSLYQLTIEKGTPFYQAYKKKAFSLPDEETSAQLYEKTESMLYKEGLKTYEVSNYAKEGFECQHNLNYWHYGDYLGIGPGAHSRITLSGKRYALMDIHHPEKWLEHALNNQQFVQQKEELISDIIVEEAIMMGLRLESGINKKQFFLRTGTHLDNIITQGSLPELIKQEMVSHTEDTLRITPKGRLLTNLIIEKLLAA